MSDSSDNDFAAYFEKHGIPHENGAASALERVLERYVGFLAEVAHDIAAEDGNETITQKHVLQACDR